MTDRPENSGESPEPENATAAPQADSDGTASPASASSPGPGPAPASRMSEVWPQVRQLLVFQVKLYVDALRDLLLSPLSIVVVIIDILQRNDGENTLFASLLRFGSKTEKAINLFNQHDVNDEDFRGIDTILMQVEEAVRREYTDGSVSANARDSIEKSLEGLRSKLRQSSREEDQNR